VSFGVIESLRAAASAGETARARASARPRYLGLLILAKKRTALVELHRMMRDGEVEKTYMAIVKGAPEKDSFEMREALHKLVTSSGERR
jgi:23S rRNA pseudouridine955/2504/2580 synthase